PGWEACRIPRTDAVRLIQDMEVRGIRGLVLREAKPLIANDPAAHPEFIPPPEGHPPITAFLGVPLIRGGQVWGLVGLANKRRGYRPSDLEAVEALSRVFLEALTRKRAEMQVRRANRALELLLECQEIISCLEDEAALVQEVCNLLVEKGGYRMAWVGYAEPGPEKRVRPVAVAGEDGDYVRQARITSSEEDERGRGPTGTAIRTGRSCVLRATEVDPRFSPWREAALHRGYRSSVALPLAAGEEVFGALNLYAAEQDAFQEQELRLLERLAAALASAIVRLRAQARAQRSEQFLAALNRAAVAMAAAAESQEVLRVAVDELATLGLWSAVLLREERKRQFTPACWSSHPGLSQTVAQTLGIEVPQFSLPEEVLAPGLSLLEGGKGLFWDRLPNLARERFPAPLGEDLAQVLEAVGLTRAAVCPLLAGDRLAGVLVVLGADLSQDDLSDLTAFAHAAAAAWHRATTRELLFRTQAQFLQAQKMEAIGRLAGGVAHDFNNQLTAIQGFAFMLARALPKDSPLQEDLEQIRKAVERSAALTRQLLLFSRRERAEKERLNLNAAVTALQKMLGRLLGEDIRVDLHLAPDLWEVEADPGQIDQVITNLAVNARDAMPKGGTLTIATANEGVDEAYCREHPEARPGFFVRLTVRDTGVGMDEHVKMHLFEPFFTTKPEGRGTGLGLSVVHGIVEAHGGWITVESEVGQGSAFHIYLPALPQPQEPVRGGKEAAFAGAAEPGGRGACILLVEDDPAVLHLATRTLDMAGYRVVACRTAAEARRAFQEMKGEADLVVSDVGLPDGTGVALVQEFLKARPTLAAFLVSGYSDTRSRYEQIEESGLELLRKPYAPDALVRKVQEHLRKRRREAERG
ncbi:MAG: GAF domain-containing protein, partial [Anaerolineae bacterium]